MSLLPALIVIFATLFVMGLVWYALSALKIRSGWQQGKGPIARWLDNRRRQRFNAQLPGALQNMNNSLRAGFSLMQAFDAVAQNGDAPIAEEFAMLNAQLRIGMSLEAALDAMTARVGSDDFSLVSTAILISRRTGGNVTEIFDRICETVRARQRVERRVLALTAQGRFQGIIVSAMPFLLAAVLTAVKPGMMIPFFSSAVGLVAVLFAIIFVAIGWLMIRRIIRIDV